MLPASTIVSPSCILLSFLKSSSIFSSEISGPCPLISVSKDDCILTLILENPLSRWTKSVFMPSLAIPFSMASPVKPATNPRASDLIPNSFNIIETFNPFPPKYISSLSVRLTTPTFISPVRTT